MKKLTLKKQIHDFVKQCGPCTRKQIIAFHELLTHNGSKLCLALCNTNEHFTNEKVGYLLKGRDSIRKAAYNTYVAD